MLKASKFGSPTSSLSRKITFSLALQACFHVLILFGSVYLSVQRLQHRQFDRSTDQDALGIWLRHLVDHPPKVSDRNGVRQMGFACHVFAELTRRGESVRTAQLSEQVFSFFPGARDMLRVLNRTPVPIMGRFERNDLGLTRKATGPPVKQRQRILSKRGVVMTVNDSSADIVMKQIDLIRSSLDRVVPIEVFFYGAGDLSEENYKAISSRSGTKVVDMILLGLFDEDTFELEGQTHDNGRARMSLALLATTFDEILFLSTGIVPKPLPKSLFEFKSYRRTGTLFLSSPNNSAEKQADNVVEFVRTQLGGMPPSATLQSSAGWTQTRGSFMSSDLFLVDRRRPGVQAALLLHAWLFSAEARHTLWHHLGRSMQESLWMVFEMAQVPFQFAESLEYSDVSVNLAF